MLGLGEPLDVLLDLLPLRVHLGERAFRRRAGGGVEDAFLGLLGLDGDVGRLVGEFRFVGDHLRVGLARVLVVPVAAVLRQVLANAAQSAGGLGEEVRLVLGDLRRRGLRMSVGPRPRFGIGVLELVGRLGVRARRAAEVLHQLRTVHNGRGFLDRHRAPKRGRESLGEGRSRRHEAGMLVVLDGLALHLLDGGEVRQPAADSATLEGLLLRRLLRRGAETGGHALEVAVEVRRQRSLIGVFHQVLGVGGIDRVALRRRGGGQIRPRRRGGGIALPVDGPRLRDPLLGQRAGIGRERTRHVVPKTGIDQAREQASDAGTGH